MFLTAFSLRPKTGPNRIFDSESRMNRLFLTLLLAFYPLISAIANPTPPAEVASLISDKPAAASRIQNFLDDVYKGGNTQLVDTSLFSPYSSGDHHYLIAKAYITFYNENVRQQIRGILLDVDSGWTFSITPEQLDYFVRTGDRSYLPQPPNLDPNAPLQTPDNFEQHPTPTHPPTPNKNPSSFIVALSRALDTHDWQTITNYTISGSVNYFGHLRVSNSFIRQDMQGDARTYASDRSIVYPETFTHEVSDEYSPRWDGPMIYDSITVYTEALENNGRLHKARTRLTVGYTVQDQHISVYALVLKVM
jgi:hypothetical protein